MNINETMEMLLQPNEEKITPDEVIYIFIHKGKRIILGGSPFESLPEDLSPTLCDFHISTRRESDFVEDYWWSVVSVKNPADAEKLLKLELKPEAGRSPWVPLEEKFEKVIVIPSDGRIKLQWYKTNKWRTLHYVLSVIEQKE